VWRLLVELGERHCEKWNKAAQRHPQDSLDAPAGRPGDDGAGPAVAAGPEAPGRPVEDEVILRECIDLLQAVEAAPGVGGPAVEHLAAILPDTDEGIGLWKRLTPRQRSVLALKCFDRTAAEIAAVLDVTQAQVNYAWSGIGETAREMMA
jgi:hypothetical protein